MFFDEASEVGGNCFIVGLAKNGKTCVETTKISGWFKFGENFFYSVTHFVGLRYQAKFFGVKAVVSDGCGANTIIVFWFGTKGYGSPWLFFICSDK